MNRMRLVMTLLCLLMLMVSATLCMALPYRPHYQGFGTDTKGGRGGKILTVDPTIADNPSNPTPNSFRWAVAQTYPRIIVFNKSGTISLKQRIDISSPYLTIAGQSAPSPGIDIVGYGIHIETNDVVIQHLRIRMTDRNFKGKYSVGGSIGIQIVNTPSYNVVIDHVSVAWIMYMGIAAAFDRVEAGQASDVSVLDSIIAFGLAQGCIKSNPDCDPNYDPNYTGSIGPYWGLGTIMGMYDGGPDKLHYSQARNLFTHLCWRCPWIARGRHHFINNVVYGSSNDAAGFAFMQVWPDYGGGYNTNPSYGIQASILNNHYIASTGTGACSVKEHPTVGTLASTKPFTFVVAPENLSIQDATTDIWLKGNLGPHVTGDINNPEDQKSGIFWYNKVDYSKDARLWYAAEPAWSTSFKRMPVAEATDYVLAHAGARPIDRDWVDKAAVSQTKSALQNPPNIAKMGSRIHSQNDMQNPAGGPAGYQELPNNSASYTLPVDPNGDADKDGYTNVEEWLEGMARAVEGEKLPAARK